MEAGADPNVVSEIGFVIIADDTTPESWRCSKDISPDEMEKEPNKYFRATPIHCAIIGSEFRRIVTLITYGADPDLEGCIISPRQYYEAKMRGIVAALASEHKEPLPDWIKLGEDAAAKRIAAIKQALREVLAALPTTVIDSIIVGYVQYIPEHKSPALETDDDKKSDDASQVAAITDELAGLTIVDDSSPDTESKYPETKLENQPT